MVRGKALKKPKALLAAAVLLAIHGIVLLGLTLLALLLLLMVFFVGLVAMGGSEASPLVLTGFLFPLALSAVYFAAAYGVWQLKRYGAVLTVVLALGSAFLAILCAEILCILALAVHVIILALIAVNWKHLK